MWVNIQGHIDTYIYMYIYGLNQEGCFLVSPGFWYNRQSSLVYLYINIYSGLFVCVIYENCSLAESIPRIGLSGVDRSNKEATIICFAFFCVYD